MEHGVDFAAHIGQAFPVDARVAYGSPRPPILDGIVALAAWSTILVGGGLVGLGRAPSWLLGPAGLVLLVAALGYFIPWLGVRLVFRAGVARHREEIADLVADEVARTALRPEHIKAELRGLVARASTDEALIGAVLGRAGPALADGAARLVGETSPEALDALEAVMQARLTDARLKQIALAELDRWFAEPKNRAAVTVFLIRFLQAESGGLVKLLKRALKRYGRSSDTRSWSLELGETFDILDWDEMVKAWRDELERTKTHKALLELVDRVADHAHANVDLLIHPETITAMRDNALGATRATAEEALRHPAMARLAALLGGPTARAALAGVLIPRVAEAFARSLDDPAFDGFLVRLDLRGRVREVVRTYPLDRVEALAARPLRALSTLGYAVGAALGGLTAGLLALAG